MKTMLPEERLLYRFRDKSFVRGGGQYFRLADAIELVRACKDAGVAVLGFDGLELEGELMYARLDLVADYSDLRASTWLEYQHKSNSAALQFLEAIDELEKTLVFDFVLISEATWHQMRAAQERRS